MSVGEKLREAAQPVKLDERLSAAAELVRAGSRCADIGADHGHLIGALAASGKISRGCACDIGEKPLENARRYLESLRLAVPVETRLGNGLSCLSQGDWDDIIIAGMGGELIWRIIEQTAWTRDGNLRFILCPMTKPERLRKSLCSNGFAILREIPVMCAGFPYSVMLAMYTGEFAVPDERFCVGGLIWDDSSEQAAAYLAKASRLVRERVYGMEKSRSRDENEIARLRNLLRQLEQKAGQ